MKKAFLSFLFLWVSDATVFAGAYFFEPLTNGTYVQRKWETPEVRWRYQATGAPENAEALVREAFERWTNVSTADVRTIFVEATDNNRPAVDGYSDIFFDLTPSEIQLSSGIIAITLRNSIQDISGGTLQSESDAIITEADILLNSNFDFVTEESDDPTSLDLVEVLTHEIGHLYGLAHSFQIDAMMYPAKPDNNTPSELTNLFRAPKRSLSRDDQAFLSALYPTSDFFETTGRIEGQVFYNGTPYVGAHVVAVKQGENDLDLTTVAINGFDEFIVKGLSNVSAFSGENGVFTIEGLEPGTYSIFVQNSDPFLTFTLSNVSDFLGTEASFLDFPNQFWSNPDCQNDETVTALTASQALQEATQIEVQAGDSLCQVELEARTSGSACGAKAGVLRNSCARASGFCSLRADMSVLAYLETHFGLFVIALGTFFFLLSIRGRLRKKLKR